MASILSKAAGGNRTALTALYEANKQTAWWVAKVLIRDPGRAVSAAASALLAALQAVLAGEIQTESAFSSFVIKQTAVFSKTEVLKQDPLAFHIPPHKEFRLHSISEEHIETDSGPLENYLNLLPTLHRFFFVLHHIENLSVSDLSSCMGLEPSLVTLAVNAEPDNTSRIYRAVKSAGGRCTPPTDQRLNSAFLDAASKESVPESLNTQIQEYIESVSVSANGLPAKKRWVLFLVISLFVIAAGILALCWQPALNNETPPAEITETAQETVAQQETEYTMPFDIAPPKAKASAKKTIYFAEIIIQDHGTITVKLDSDAAPITVENFVSLAKNGFYNGLTFHRIMEGFMMQGGDPNGDGTGGSDKTIHGEFADNGCRNPLSHTRGAISMARSNDYNSASSQFFLVHEDSTFLDGQYAVFGYVTDGIEILDAICSAAEPTDNNGTILPEDQPIITAVHILEVTEKEPVVAQIKEIREDGTLLLHLYEQEESDEAFERSDYANLDFDHFAYAFDTMHYSLDKNAVIKIAGNGVLTDGNMLSLSVGDMVILEEKAGADVLILHKNIYS